MRSWHRLDEAQDVFERQQVRKNLPRTVSKAKACNHPAGDIAAESGHILNGAFARWVLHMCTREAILEAILEGPPGPQSSAVTHMSL